MIILMWFGLLVVVVWLYFRQLYSRFEKHGVKNIKPVPFFGNIGRVILRKEHLANNIQKLYKTFPEERFVGRYESISDMVVIRDLELIKKITIKDFEHFVDHRGVFDDDDSFMQRTLIMLKGQEWKHMRSALSPAFTSSKIKQMVPLMIKVGDQLIASLKNSIESSRDGYIDLECKDLTSRYTNDVIASCAFGLQVDSHKERNNEFYKSGEKITTPNLKQFLKITLLRNAPKIAKYLKVEIISQNMSDFFNKMVLDTMKNRELNQIMRPDMIHLLMQLQKGQLKHESNTHDDKTTGFATVEESIIGTKDVDIVWNDKDLVAQAFLFFLAGFETISTAAIFFLHEVALHPEIQEKLRNEINENCSKNDGKFDLKSIQEMKYLDMVVSEVLRKWPPVIALDRKCVKDYNMGRPNEKSNNDFIIRKGSTIAIPVYAYHRDPQYFPDPDKFDPERFSDKNKHKINPLAYMPFGVGPRNCIGSRFALAEFKVMVYQILQHFEVSPCEKTCIPEELSPKSLNMRLKGGNWVRFTGLRK